jgi:hypothetical protein
MGRTDDDETPAEGAEEDAQEREERAAILKRRAKFVASAIAGLSLAASCSDAGPGACLKMSAPDGDKPTTTGTASATASATSEPPDAGVDAGEVDAGTSSSASSSASASQTAPQPCLEVAPPRPCLKIAPPPKPCLKVAPKPCLNMDNRGDD